MKRVVLTATALLAALLLSAFTATAAFAQETVTIDQAATATTGAATADSAATATSVLGDATADSTATATSGAATAANTATVDSAPAEPPLPSNPCRARRLP